VQSVFFPTTLFLTLGVHASTSTFQAKAAQNTQKFSKGVVALLPETHLCFFFIRKTNRHIHVNQIDRAPHTILSIGSFGATISISIQADQKLP